MSDISPEIFINGGLAGVCVLLIIYNAYKDRLTASTLEKFNATMGKHLDDMGQVMKENTKAIQQASDHQMQAVEIIKENTEVITEMRAVIKEIYNRLLAMIK